jgi:hypothetical protein
MKSAIVIAITVLTLSAFSSSEEFGSNTNLIEVEENPQTELLLLLVEWMDVNPEEWPEEMLLTVYPGGVEALVGATGDELLSILGDQNTGPEFREENSLSWHIGVLPEASRNFPPVLIVSLDENGVVEEANWYLSM